MKTPVIILILTLLATIATASTVTLAPGSVYETTTAWQTLDVNNYKASSTVTTVTATSSLLDITNAENYTGWTTAYSTKTVNWTGGTIETNVKSAVFEFQTKAPKVTTDTNTTIIVGAGNTTVLNIQVLNDATPPNVTNITPSQYAKANNPAQTISATIIDSETSTANASYSYNDCAGGNDTNVALTQTGNNFAGTANFGSYDEGETACYTITATNTPGETGTTTGQILFDGTPPTVTAISPTTYATENTTFTFTASDNLATSLSCTVKLDNTQVGQVSIANGTNGSVTADLTNFSEGSRTWSVTCADGVGLSATNAKAITLDTKAPFISISYNPFIPRTTTNTFTATVTDTISVASVLATLDGNNVTLTPSGNDYSGSISSNTLGTKNLTVTATDNAGHVQTEMITLTIVPNHIITISLSDTTIDEGDSITASGTLSADGNTTNTTVTIKTPNGDEAETLDANGDYSTTFTVNNDGTYDITVEYVEGGYTYTATKTLTVNNPNSPSSSGSSSNGLGSSWNGGAGYVKPQEQTTTDDSDNQNQQTEETSSEPTPEPSAYEPLAPEEPRQAYTPKATGIFSLGGTIKWLSILLALALITGLGVYGWKNRGRKDDSGIDWDGYFKGQ